MIRDNIRMDVENLTCTGGRRLAVIREELEKMDDDAMFFGLCRRASFPDAVFPYEQQYQKEPAVSGPESEGNHLSYDQVLRLLRI